MRSAAIRDYVTDWEKRHDSGVEWEPTLDTQPNIGEEHLATLRAITKALSTRDVDDLGGIGTIEKFYKIGGDAGKILAGYAGLVVGIVDRAVFNEKILPLQSKISDSGLSFLCELFSPNSMLTPENWTVP